MFIININVFLLLYMYNCFFQSWVYYLQIAVCYWLQITWWKQVSNVI